MINHRIIARIFSKVLITEGLFMLLPAGVDVLYHEHCASSFLYSAIITLVTGVLVFTPLRSNEKVYGTREGYIIISGIWFLFSIFGTMPFLFSGSAQTFTDAFFESVSGFTTTGATIFQNVESVSHGILLWRSLSQWLGGLALIFLSLYIVPVLKTVNIQLPTAEFSIQKSDKLYPKASEAGKMLISIYCLLTLAETVLLVIGEMPFFDAFCHSLSTLSTGGFTTRNTGMAAFSSPYIKAVITVFMFLAGTNLTIIYLAAKRNFKKIISNNEFIFYLILVIAASVTVSALLYFDSGFPAFKSVQNGFFHVISFISTTGFYSENYNLWSNLLILITFMLMFTGGMAGSTTGGIKIIRLMIVTKSSLNESKRKIHPFACLPLRFDRKTISQNVVYNILVFIALYFIVLCSGALIFSLLDYDIITSFSTVASMLSNTGPGIGAFGPFEDYSVLPATGKWILSMLMVVGRLEILTVIILFSRSFYKR